MVRTLVVLSLSSSVAASAQGIDKAYARAAQAVVTVRGDQDRSAEGSGVVLHADGFIATAAHLVAHSDSVSVQLADGTLVPARLVTVSRSEDTALLKVDKLPPGHAAATLSEASATVGQQVFTVVPRTRALTTGIVRTSRAVDPRSPIGAKDVLLVDEALNEAGMGSAVFDGKGEVVGLLTNLASLGRTGGKGHATPAAQLRKRLFTHPIPYLGMALRYVGPDLAKLFNWPVQHALLVEWVKPGSAAANGGLQGGTVEATVDGVPIRLGGDLIVKLGDFDLSKSDEIGQFLSSRKSGSVLHYSLLRGGKPVEAQVLVEETIKVPPLKAGKK